MVSLLKQWGYTVFYPVLNTRTQGLPHSRPRCYMVAFRKTVERFQWPPEIDAVPLSRLLQQVDPKCFPHLTAAVQKRIDLQIKHAKDNLGTHLGRADEAVVDAGPSAAWWSYPLTDVVPCLDGNYDGLYYLLKRERFITDTEVARVQGIPDVYYDKFASSLG